MNTSVPLVGLRRGGVEEVTFFGELVVSDDKGPIWSASEGIGAYPARSLLKPFQFLACGLPIEKWRGQTRYAPCVGSVSATSEQVQGLESWYGSGRLKTLVDALQVPPSAPWDLENKVLTKGRGPQRIFHMCFSKHAAILEACETHGWDPASYLSPGHPFHQKLVVVLSETLGRDFKAVEWVTDGCQLPSPVLSLADTARLYQKLAFASEESPLGAVRQMMLANPAWIGGPDRTDTALMAANPGRLVAKEGADGLLGLAVMPTPKHPKGLGIVVKVASGFDMKAAALILAPLLKRLGLESVHQTPVGQTAEWKYRPLERYRRKYIDISPVVGPETAVWPGDRKFSRDVSLDTLKGNHLTLSSITTTVHIGAHTDAPNHYEASDRGIESVDVSKYAGPCQVVEVKKAPSSRIVPVDLRGFEVRAPRVLFKTGSFPNPNHFNTDFVTLSGELIEWLAGQGVCLVGIDTPSIDLFDSKDLPSHLATLKTGVAVLEGIVLADVKEGLYELSAVPLKIQGADASPVRALLF